jgi:acetyl-CoA C-acetyltransferase
MGVGGVADTLPLLQRPRPLEMRAAALSAAQALEQARLTPAEIDFFEAHDAYTSMAAASIEASGFARPGHAVAMAEAGAFERDGVLPIATFGGLKARGHPVGATGVYQAAEAFWQLMGAAGAAQLPFFPTVRLVSPGVCVLCFQARWLFDHGRACR